MRAPFPRAPSPPLLKWLALGKRSWLDWGRAEHWGLSRSILILWSPEEDIPLTVLLLGLGPNTPQSAGPDGRSRLRPQAEGGGSRNSSLG